MLTDEEATRVIGSPLVSAQGEELGEVDSVLTHAADHRAAWALSTVAGRSVAVPLDGARTEEGRLVVRYDSERISSAPGVEGDALDEQSARKLYEHYGIDDSTLREDSGLATEEGAGGVSRRTGDPRGATGADDATQGHP